MAEIIRIRCRGCQVKIKAPLNYQGRAINCPQCGHEIQIPILKSESSAAKPTAPQPALVAPAAPTRATKPKVADDPPRKKKEEEPLELTDDAFVEPAEAADPWDFDNAGYDDYEDFESQPKPRPKRKKKPAATSRRPAKKKRKPAEDDDDDSDGWVEQGSIWGGIVMMVGAIVWFVVGLRGGIIFYYPPILFILGIVAFVKGLMGD